MNNKRVFIGVAWPYVNGTLHIGHLAGYQLPADISARFHRLTGKEVLMVSGSDCFGTPVTLEADKRGVSPAEIVEEYHEKNADLFLNTLDLSYSLYTRTDNLLHRKITQEVFLKMLEDGYIYADSTNQYYSDTKKRFLPDRYVVGECPHCNFKESRSDQCDQCGKLISEGTLIDPKGTLGGDSVEMRETEHYFLDWKKLQPFLEEYVSKHGGKWKKWVESETKGWLKEGLAPRAITRDIDWGVPLPKTKIPQNKLIENIDSKRIYVWFDAVIGYLSASQLWAKETGNSWEDFWVTDSEESFLKHYYFMGKDNLVFHTLFWPGQLHIYDPGLHLPDDVSINMFLNLDGKNFSKSRGISVDIEDIVKKYGNSAVRFYLTLIMPEYKDSSFSWKDFEEKVNGILVANLGNFIHRVLSIGKDTDISGLVKSELAGDVSDKINRAALNSIEHLENNKFRAYLDEILSLSQFGNRKIDSVKLWDLKKQDGDEFHKHLSDLYVIVLSLMHLTSPLLPEASKKLAEMFSLEVNRWEQEGFAKQMREVLEKSTVPKNPLPLFTRIDTKEEYD